MRATAPSGVRLRTALALAVSVVCAMFSAAPALAAKPAKGGRYFGVHGLDTIGSPVSDFSEVDSYLRVSRSGRRLGRSSEVVSDCGSIFLKRSRRRYVRISRGGRFRLDKRHGRLRVRLSGRFVSRGHAKIVYSVRKTRSRCVARNQRVGLYLKGQPPFSGCRTQRATNIARGPTGRVFEQDRYVRDGFFPHVYACLYETNKRFRLGQNYDDEVVDPVDLAGPYVGYYNGSIDVRDLRSGRLLRSVDAGAVGCGCAFGSNVYAGAIAGLQVKENGSVGWIVQERRCQCHPGVELTPARVYAVDTAGRRLLDAGPGVQADSLKLSGSTLTWIRDGALRSATLD